MSPIRRRDDPVTLAAAVWSGLHLPLRKTVRDELVITLVAKLYDMLM